MVNRILRDKKKIIHAVILLLIVVVMLLHFRVEGEKKQTLRIGCFTDSEWSIPDRKFETAVEKAIEKFNEKYPDIEIKYISGIRESDYSEWLMEEFLGGSEPDVFLIRHDDLFTLQSRGALLDLNSYLKSDTEISSKDYYPALMERTGMKNALYALPFMCDPLLMAVNDSIMSKKGIEYVNDEWNWGDFHRACRHVSVSAKEDDRYYGFCEYSWKMAAISNGVRLFNIDGSQNYFDSRGVYQAVKYFYNIKTYMSPDKDFFSGKVAFSPMKASDYRRNTVKSQMISRFSDFSWHCTSMPAGPAGDNISETELLSAGISSRSGKKKEAWDFLKIFCGDNEVQESILESAAALPVKKNVIKAHLADSDKMDFEMLDTVLEHALVPSRFNGYEDILMKTDNGVERAIESSQDLRGALLDVHRSIGEMSKR